MLAVTRTADEWFLEAARCYLEKHQGCAWCGGSHRVFHLDEARGQTFYCHGCDFRVTYDRSARRHIVVPGEEQSRGRDTMLEF